MRRLLRAVGAEGRVVSYERREDFADVARANVTAFFGAILRYRRDDIPAGARRATVQFQVFPTRAPS